MSSTINIYQSQSVLFTDTTSGGLPPYSRLWSFSGGNISSATGATALVSYASPGSYTAILTVTDDAGVSASFTSSSGIVVNAPVITSSFTKSLSSVLMSQQVTFTDTSTGLPSGPTGWQWSAGGSSYATTQNSTRFYDNWQNVPGANLADVGGTVVNVTIALQASNSFTSGTSTQSVPFSKIGASEMSILNRDSPGGAYGRYADVSYTGVIASSLGYPTPSYVYEIDFDTYGTTINHFHSDLEDAGIILTGLTGKSEFLLTGVSSIAGYIIVNDALYATGDPEIAIGKYIYPSLGPTKLFFADDGSAGNISDLINSHNWTTSLVASILDNIHPQLNSAQSIYYGIVYPVSAFSGGRNPIVYSPQYLTSVGAGGQAVQVRITVTLGSSYLTICDFDGNSGVGNETGGNYYTMQDVGPNVGIASMLNSSIAASSIPGGTGTLEFFADQSLNIFPGSTPANYSGLRLEVKDNTVSEVFMTDNIGGLNTVYGLSLFPVFYTYTGSTQSSCIGIPSGLDLTNLQYDANGTNITYGNSIY